ncbi:MAG TPA: efflux RND transporter periplasmic adaptor subunit [Steroidobacteraceae bacterium]|nr:efflux RND transporter periplasmic adaptor subunit [Steroidobacteraceae bacterium]
MKDYRSGFWAALAVNVVLIAAVAGLWWHSRPAAPTSAAERPVVGAATPASAATAASAVAGEVETPLAPMHITAQRLQSIGVKIGEVERKSVADEIRTTGNVAVDETRLVYVQVRFSGYLQKVFVDATYQYVHKGEPLFTIYSPELVAAEREYLLARQSRRRLARSTDHDVIVDAASLEQAAAARLRQWGIPAREIARLESTGKVRQNLEIDSPAAGYVTAREALPNLFVQPGTRLYTIADLSRIWVFAQAFQSDLGRLRVGDSATLTVDSYPGWSLTGRIDFIYPDVDMATRTARVRLAFGNPALKLTPGMFVNADIHVPMGRQLVIPAAGVLQTGTRAVAFVDRGDGTLIPRTVQLGARVGDQYIVLHGLRAGEKIVTSANFLIDSESELQAALGAFAPSSPMANGAAGYNAPRATVHLTTDPDPPRKGSNRVRVQLTNAAGSPIGGAQVTVIFLMPAMPAMGMTGMRVPVTLSDRGGGNYEGSAELGSGGIWQVTIAATKDGHGIAGGQVSLGAAGGG